MSRSLRVLPVILALALTSACGVRVARSSSAPATSGSAVEARSPRRTGVPADERSASRRGESPPGHARRDGDERGRPTTPADQRSASSRGERPPGHARDDGRERGRPATPADQRSASSRGERPPGRGGR